NSASNCSAATSSCSRRGEPMPSAAPRWVFRCWARETILMGRLRLDDDQFGVERAGLFQGLKDAHDVVRGGAQAVDGVDDAFQAGAFGPLEHAVGLLSDVHVGTW